MGNNAAALPDGARARLLDLAQARGVSLAALSDFLGRNPSYIQQFIRKGSPRRLEEADRHKLAQFFGVDENALRDPTEKSYSQVSAPSGEAAWVDVPRLDLGASAGPGAVVAADEAPFDTFRFSRRWLAEQGFAGRKLAALRVAGDSMEPLLNDGDEILVDCTPRPFRDGIHVVRLGDSLLVKRVAQAGAGRLALLSQNLAYPPVEVASDEVAMIGRVVWKGGRI